MNRMIFETSRIILKAPFEIYDTLFGVKQGQKYNMDIIREIENILETHPGIMFDDIKKKIDLLNNNLIVRKKNGFKNKIV